MSVEELAAVASGTASVPFAVEEAPAEEAYENDPTPSLLSNSNWKARKAGYERCRDFPEECEHLLQGLPLAAKESNPAAMEALLEALCVAVRTIPASMGEVAERFMGMLTDKALCGRPKAVHAGTTLLLLFVQASGGGKVVEGLTVGFANKSPKVRLGSTAAAIAIVKETELKGIPAKQFLKATAPLFSDADARVRKDAQTLCGECYRFAGPSIKAYLGDLRDIQLQELDRLFETIEVAGTSVNVAAETAVLSKLPKDFFAVVSNKGEKWTERQAMVKEVLLPLLSTPKINPNDDYAELVRLLRDLVNDPQLPLSMIGIKCVQEMARSLRKAFAAYVRIIHPCLFEKFKEKKATTVENLFFTYDTLFQHECMQFDLAVDDIATALETSKVPHHRVNLIQWVSHCASKFPNAIPRLSRTLPLAKVLVDEKLEVRDAAILLFQQLVAVTGVATFSDTLAVLDKKTLAKLNIDEGGDVALRQVQSAVVTPVTSPTPAEKKANGPKRTASGPSLKPSSAKAAPSGGSAPIEASGELPSLSEAQMHLCTALADVEPFLEDSCSKEWRVRSEALTNIAAVFEQLDTATATELAEPLVAFVSAQPGWKDSIVQVTVALVNLLSQLSTQVATLSPRCCHAIVEGCFPKLAEPKLKAPLQGLLMQLAEVCSPKRVVKELMQASTSCSTPKACLEATEWISSCIAGFPSSPLDAKAIVDHTKNFCFEQSAPAMRTAGIKVLVTLRQRVGPKLDAFLVDINPHIRSTFDAEVAKLSGGRQQPTATREVRGAPAENSDAFAGSASGAISDGDFPRTDVTSQLLPLAKEISGGNDWKVRQSGVKGVERCLVGANKNAQATPVCVGDTMKALRGRLDEPNKNFVTEVLRVMIVVTESFPPTLLRPSLKAVFPAAILMVGDQKPGLRDAAIELCNAAVQILGLEATLPPLSKALANDSQSLRQPLVELLAKALPQAALPVRALAPILVPLLKLLGDRNGEVRASAEIIGVYVFINVGAESFSRALMDMKPAEQTQLRACVDRIQQKAVELQPPTPMENTPRMSPRPKSQQQPQSQQNFGIVHADPNGPMESTGPSGTSPPTNKPPTNKPYDVQHPPEAYGGQRQQEPIQQQDTTKHLSPPSACAPMGDLSVDELINVLLHMGIDSIICACQELTSRLQQGVDIGNPQLLEAMFQCLRRVCCHSTFTNESVKCLLSVVQQFLSNKDFTRRCDVVSMTIICDCVFDCLLTEVVAAADTTVIKSLNMITLQLIQHPCPDTVFEALMHHMGSYAGRYIEDPSTLHHKYLELVARCLLRLRHDVTTDVLINTIHCHLMAYPPSRFKERDDLSVRTVKTLLKNAAQERDGLEVLQRCEALTGQASLVYHFLDYAVRSKQQQATVEALSAEAAENNKQRASAAPTTSSSYQPRGPALSNSDPSSEPPTLTNVAPNVCAPAADPSCIATLFTRARKHSESEAALGEIYSLLKTQPHCMDEFNGHLSRCSEAFAKYMKRKLLRLREDDPAAEGFALPFDSGDL